VVLGFQPLVVGTTLGLGITLLPQQAAALHGQVRLSTSKKIKLFFIHFQQQARSLSFPLTRFFSTQYP
jgi:hypothetical protein